MKKIVVFGATGTVGAYLCDSFRKNEKYQIIAVGSRKSDNGFFKQIGIEYISVDITQKEEFVKLPNEVYAIVHLAGILPARMKGYNPQSYIDINITGTLNILEYAEKVKVNRIIYSQSISDIIHLCGSKDPISADSNTSFPINNDHSIYSISKNAAVDMIRHYAVKNNFKYYILRFPNIYLYHPDTHYYVDGVKKWQNYRLMIDKAIKGETLEIWGDPKIVRDIVYVKDCIQIIEKSIECESAESGTYNVGTGIGVTMEEQVKGIVQVFSSHNNKSSEIIYKPEKPNSIEYIFDISKNIEQLNYHPQYSYIEYLEDMKKEMELNRFALLWGYPENY